MRERVWITVIGTQLVVEHGMTGSSITGGSNGGEGVISVVDTIVETLNVEITDVPERVAVGVCWQAMRRNYS